MDVQIWYSLFSSFSIAANQTNAQGYQISLPSLNSRGFSLKITIIALLFFVIWQENRNIYLQKNDYSRRKLKKLLFEIFFGRMGGSTLMKEIPGKHGKIEHFADKIKYFTKLRWVNPSPACVPVVWSSLFARVRYKIVDIVNKKYIFSGFYFMQTYLQKWNLNNSS